MKTLEGKRALVTGGGTGIGRGISRRLLEAGAAVTIVGRTEEVLSRTASELGSEIDGAVVKWQRCDVTSYSDVQAAVATAAGGGRLDIMVANAGGMGSFAGPFLYLDEDAWRSTCEINIIGTANSIRAAAWNMREAGGTIIATSTAASVAPQKANAHYSATKAAVNMMVQNAAWELGRFGITVNALLPGYTVTGMGNPDPSLDVATPLLERTALGRPAQPEEHGDLVVFLAGPGGRYITGQLIAVDGGMGVQPMTDLSHVTRSMFGDEMHDDAFGAD